MWILIFLFGLSTLFLGWIFGYYILLYFIGLFKKEESKIDIDIDDYPFLTVIVTCYNEEADILRKVNNLKGLDYPEEKMEIIFADGGSTDDTKNIIKETISELKNGKLVECPQKGKINQMNYILPELKGQIIINTDVDGLLKKNCLIEIVREFKRDSKAMVVGAYCIPRDTVEIEEYYWLNQNKGRIIEARALTSSIAIAVCYAFKKELLSKFPEDVIADDIYVAYLANTKGYKTVYSEYAVAEETRTPKTLADFLVHKFRKSNAFLQETLRFLYQLPKMGNLWRVIYLTKLLQLLLLPWVVIFWLILGTALMSLRRWDIVFLDVLLLLILVTMTHGVFKWVKITDKRKRYPVVIIVKTFLLSNLILFATGLSYSFFKQDSSYKRIRNEKR